jgi:hypothetical protein
MLPKTREPDSEEIKHLINHAVQLRNDMTKELAIYFPYWIEVGVDVLKHSEAIEYDGEPQSRSLALCVFPALARRVKNGQGKLSDVCVTRAKVELE